MHIYIFSFTKQGAKTSTLLYNHFSSLQIACIAFTPEKYCSQIHTPLFLPLKEQVKQCFHSDNVLIFVSACGIAVRSIAPFVKDKTTDPCVLVTDELGQYVISLLSGHIGGGNEMAVEVSNVLHATPVISTATDLHGTFAVDLFAKKNQLALSDMSLAKKVSASLLHGIPVGICGDVPDAPLPAGITKEICDLEICISPFYHTSRCPETLYLIPRQMVLGIGCKRGTAFENLCSFVDRQLKELSIFPEAVAAVTSIDLKKEEPALLQLARHYHVPFVTYSADTLRKVPCSQASSDFVKSVTGVDNVCERSTLAYTHASSLILPKTVESGMTLAISQLVKSVSF